MVNELAGLWAVLVLLALLVLVLWVLLPFAVFGIKPLLRQVLEQQREHTRLLGEIAAQVRPSQADTLPGPTRGP